jgi:hypothetical protein
MQPASGITEDHDWWPLAEQLAMIVGEPLLAAGVRRPRHGSRVAPRRCRRPGSPGDDQLALDLGR